MILNKPYCVYIHILPNKKIYIGITSNIPKKRWGKNGYGYRNNILFKRAIDKYGWENIKHEILYTNLSEQEAKDKEVELIALYKSNNPKYGYNISMGGDYTTLGYKFSEKQKEKLKKAKFKPIYCIEENKIYNSADELKNAGYKYYNAYLNGRRITYHDKHLIRVDDLDKFNNGEIKLKPCFKRKVICLETKKIYDSIANAAKDTKTRENSISECCSGKLKSANKLHWKYYYEEFIMEKCEEYIKEMKKINKKTKKVICLETKEIFDNCFEASKQLKISHINECCNNKRKTAGGYHFKYYEEVIENAL